MSDLVKRLNQHALPDPNDEREVLHAPLLREAADMIEQQAAEITRLNQCLKWQQDRADRICTHSDGCWAWGYKHYECALDEIARLKEILK